MKWLVLMLSGCSLTSGIVGARGTTTKLGRSAELEAGVSGGVGDRTFAFSLSEQGSVGVASNGQLQGRVLTGGQYDSFGEDFGWQAGVFTGVSLGAFQDQDLTFAFEAGPHWNFSSTYEDQKIKTWSLELDLGVGYAFHIEDPERADGVMFSLSLATRFDNLDLLAIKR